MVATGGRGAAGAEEPRQPGHPYSILLQQCDETRKNTMSVFVKEHIYRQII